MSNVSSFEIINAEKVLLTFTITSEKYFLKDERECLAACCGAPMMQINHKYYENLTIEKVDKIFKELDDEK